MQTRNSVVNKRRDDFLEKSPVETFKGMGSSVASNVANTVLDIGKGIGGDLFDAIVGAKRDFEAASNEQKTPSKEENFTNFQRKVEFKTLYNFQQEQEIRTIKELTKKIHEEIMALKRANTIFTESLKDVEKVTLSSADFRAGIYHVRFLELVLELLKSVREKVSESSVWLSTVNGRKRKKGFGHLSKSNGSSYSQSDEHKVTRNTQ
jgi:hypothetical protein